jgi:hypothetical protein
LEDGPQKNPDVWLRHIFMKNPDISRENVKSLLKWWLKMVKSCYIAIASKNVSIKSKKSVAEPCCHCCRHRLPKTCTALLWQTSGYRYLDLVGWLRLTSTWGCSRGC